MTIVLALVNKDVERPTSRTVEETRILEAQKREIEEVPETFGRKRRKIATTTTTTTATAAQAKSSGLMTATKKAPKAVQQTVLLQMCLKRAASLYGGDVKEAVEYVTSRIPVSVDPAEFKEYATLLQGEEGEEAKLLDLLFGDKNDIRELIGMEGKAKPHAGCTKERSKLGSDLSFCLC